MDHRRDLDRCVEDLIGIFERSSRVLEESHWFPSEPGSMRWWGGLETPLEIIVTAVLVKLSRWRAALTALESMRRRGILELSKLSKADPEEMVETIKGVGFAKSKVRTIIAISRYIEGLGGVEVLVDRDVYKIRRGLLEIEGVGKETADSILLFALNKPVFPVARLSVRVLARYCGGDIEGYEYARERIERALERDLYKLKLLHAGLIAVASRFCRNRDPLCGSCLLGSTCYYRSRSSWRGDQ